MRLSIIAQLFLLLFLLAKDKNDGEKDLFKRQQWNVLDVVIALALYAALPLYFAVPAYVFFECGVDLRPFLYAMTNRAFVFYGMALCLVLLIVTFKVRFKQRITMLGIGRANLKRNIALGVCIGLAAFVTFNELYLLFLPKRFQPEVAEMVAKSRTIVDYIFVFGGVVFLGPLVEEVVYRGILYSPLRKKYGPVKAIIIASLFFGIGHPNWPKAFVIGIVLTTLYEKTESIISTYIAHSTINLLVLASAFYYLR